MYLFPSMKSVVWKYHLPSCCSLPFMNAGVWSIAHLLLFYLSLYKLGSMVVKLTHSPLVTFHVLLLLVFLNSSPFVAVSLPLINVGAHTLALLCNFTLFGLTCASLSLILCSCSPSTYQHRCLKLQLIHSFFVTFLHSLCLYFHIAPHRVPLRLPRINALAVIAAPRPLFTSYLDVVNLTRQELCYIPCVSLL